MDYEKKYKEALEKAQRFYNNSVAITKKGLEEIFPEVKESEDEEIKEMLKVAVERTPWMQDKKEKCYEWLEKQGEQKQCMYSKDNYTKEDRKVLCEGCEEKCEFNQVKESAILQHKKETCKENGDSLTQEPVNDELEKAAVEAFKQIVEFEDEAKWKVKNLWKPAYGDDLPEIDREVIAILDNGKVGFAHRPPEYWDGKNIITGKITRYYPKTYGKGGWNIPDVKFWLGVELPKETEL